MLCPNCQRENQEDARFCIFCGTPLQESAADEFNRRPAAANEEIASLREMLHEVVSRITERLDALEKGQPTVPPQPPLPEAPFVTSESEAELQPETVLSTPVEEPAPTAMFREVEAIPAEGIPPRKEKPVREEKWEWEQILGGSWLARIGVLALVIGIGFFLKYAFDNNWLGPTGRVILGIIAGLVMVGGGYYWRKKYPVLTQVLSGGGIAALYLSIFASFAIFDLVHFYVAVAFLFLVSVASAILALNYDSMSLAIIGILGAFIAPFILGAFRTGGIGVDNAGQAIQLLAYVVVVDLGVLVLSTFRSWRWFTLLALACSLIAFGVWYGEFDWVVSEATAWIWLTIIFLVFVGATTLFHIIWRRSPQVFDFTLIMINAAAYFGISLGLLWDAFRGWMGTFVFILALFYGAVSYMAYRRRAENTDLSLLTLGIALVFLTVAIPVQLGDKVWTTIAWAGEGTVLMWLAFRVRMPVLSYSSHIVFFAVAIRLLFFDTRVDIETFQPVFNERFLAFITSILAMSLTTYFLWRNRKEGNSINYLFFLGASIFFTFWLIGAEVYSYSHEVMTVQGSLSLLILLLLAGVAILHRLAWRREPHMLDLFLTVFNAVACIIISIFVWDVLRVWMGTAYFTLAFFYGILSYTLLKRGADSATLGSVSLGLAIAFFTAAIAIQLEDTVWTTIAWAVEGTVLVWLLFTRHIPDFRYYGYIVFFAVVIRLIFFDTRITIETFQPVLNERFMAFIISIAMMYLAGYYMLRERKISGQGKADAVVFLIAANFFTLWLFSFEIWDFYANALTTTGSAVKEGLNDAQNLSLTAVWAVYAVICLVIGILKRLRYLRLGALALLIIPIGKVFVYDVFQLELGYRIGAFVGLGLLLLISAYLYQRYSKAIKGVFIEK